MTNILDFLNIGHSLIDKLIPDANQKQQLKLQLAQLAQQGSLDELNDSYKAIVTEAASQDKWTSRARPSFMYVMYVLLLVAVPYGVWSAVHPSSAIEFSNGAAAWFRAIPDKLYDFMALGFVGYSVTRSYDKMIQVKHG